MGRSEGSGRFGLVGEKGDVGSAGMASSSPSLSRVTELGLGVVGGWTLSVDMVHTVEVAVATV